jgi:hypothetical protein
VAADGTVAVTYYDFRNNTGGPGLPTDYWMVYANPHSPGGLTNPASWTHELRLTDTSFNMENAYVSFDFGPGAYFLGDYQSLAASGNSFVAMFGATLSQPYTSNIFARRIDFQDGGVACSAALHGSAGNCSAGTSGARSLASSATAQPHGRGLEPGVLGRMPAPTSAGASPAPAASHGKPPAVVTSAHANVAASSQAAAAVTPAAALDHLSARRRNGHLFDGLADDLDVTG